MSVGASITEGAGSVDRARPSARGAFLRRVVSNRSIASGLGLIAVMVVLAIIYPLLPLPDPFAIGGDILAPPSAEHLFGTDELGRDLLSRILAAIPSALWTVVASVGMASVIGLALGLFSGYLGGWLDALLGRLTDMLLAFPAVFIALAVVVVVGPGESTLLIAITIAECPVFARLARASTLATRERDHVASAVAIGASPLRVVLRHVMPFALGPLAVQVAIAARTTIVLAASLNFLGIGLQPPAPSWGNMIARSQNFLYDSITYAVFPAIAIVALVLAFNFISDGLHRIIDPRPAVRPFSWRRPARTPGEGATPGASASPALLSVRDLSVGFPVAGGVVHAVDRVSFDLAPGEILGIVGESGSGKSVTSQAVMGLLNATDAGLSGSVRFQSSDILSLSERELQDVRGRSIAMIFQDPMTALNPVVTVGRQIVEQLQRHLGLGSAEARRRTIDLLRKVGIPDPDRRIDEYAHQFSGGMRQRVMIAMALSCDPKVLIADEPTTALDVTTQAQILDILRDLRNELGLAIIFITHDLGVLAGLADRVMVMYGGRVLETGPADIVYASPHHPYTRALFSAVPRIDEPRRGQQLVIPGSPPDLSRPPAGCVFWDRCPLRSDPRCESVRPELRSVGPDHMVATFCELPNAMPANG